MSIDRGMVDKGTGASPPCSPTREVACSPINFHCGIDISTSDDFEDDLMLNQQMKMRKDHVKVMKRYVLMNFCFHICTITNINSCQILF